MEELINECQQQAPSDRPSMDAICGALSAMLYAAEDEGRAAAARAAPKGAPQPRHAPYESFTPSSGVLDATP